MIRAAILVVLLACSASAGQFSTTTNFSGVVRRVGTHANEGAGTTAKTVEGPNFTNVAGWVSGPFNKAILLAGTEVVSTPMTSLAIGDGCWVSLWFNINSVAAQTFVTTLYQAAGTLVMIGVDEGGAQGLGEYQGGWGTWKSWSGTRDFRDGKWHLLGAFRGATVAYAWDFYVDGEFISRQATGKTLAGSTVNTAHIGGAVMGGAQVGVQIDDWAVYKFTAPNPNVAAWHRKLYSEGKGRHAR